MKKLLFLFALFFLSCADKKTYVHNPQKNELLAFTQKYEYIKSNENRFVVVGTYLNPILFKNEFSAPSENFILLLYPDSLLFDEESVKINGKDEDIQIKELQEDDELVKDLPINVPWGKYYLITSPAQKADKLTLSCLISDQQIKLTFVKVSASMYWTQKR